MPVIRRAGGRTVLVLAAVAAALLFVGALDAVLAEIEQENKEQFPQQGWPDNEEG